MKNLCVPLHTKWTVVILHGTNRRLQLYGVQTEVCADTVTIDVCTTSTCQSDLVITSPCEKATNTQIPRLGSLIPTFVCYYTFYTLFNRAIGLMSRVFANGPGDRGSIPGRVIQKTQKVVLDAALLNTQHYKIGIKGKVQQKGKE